MISTLSRIDRANFTTFYIFWVEFSSQVSESVRLWECESVRVREQEKESTPKWRPFVHCRITKNANLPYQINGTCIHTHEHTVHCTIFNDVPSIYMNPYHHSVCICVRRMHVYVAARLTTVLSILSYLSHSPMVIHRTAMFTFIQYVHCKHQP